MFFISVGDVISVDVIKEGSAFVEFRNSENVEKAIKTMNKYVINGRKILVKDVRNLF